MMSTCAVAVLAPARTRTSLPLVWWPVTAPADVVVPSIPSTDSRTAHTAIAPRPPYGFSFIRPSSARPRDGRG
ncbi:hypothetical protein [Saccharothrix sp. Mg75]|uniref:hypothetical protein n=1 Tax=Saccharothrix sp. Mg75 TaxID=3445357 RepID=UPI003EE87DFB